MKVKGISGIKDLSLEQIREEVDKGAKFVQFEYCMSILIITLRRRSSDIYYIRPNESTSVKCLPYVFISLIAGWWGIPWGPIYTIRTIVKNFSGGEDVTLTTLSQLLRAFDSAPNNNRRVFKD